MNSIRCEHHVIEFMIHRFSLMDMVDRNIDDETLHVAKKPKSIS